MPMNYTAMCRYCFGINTFGLAMGSEGCYCSKCGKNPLGKMKVFTHQKPRYKYNWKLGKADRVV